MIQKCPPAAVDVKRVETPFTAMYIMQRGAWMTIAAFDLSLLDAESLDAKMHFLESSLTGYLPWDPEKAA